LPPFAAARLPFDRGAYRLEHGPDAGRRLHFLDHGGQSAPALLLLHGNPTWSFLWRKVMTLLPEFRCIAPDLLGLGFSDRLPRIADHHLDRHAEAITELTTALGLPRFILVGQDWGGPVATGVGARHSDRVTGVVLANTAVVLPRHPRGTAFHRFARMPVLSDLVFRGLGFPQNILSRVQGDRRSIRGEVARAYRYPLRRLRDRIAPLAFARMVPDGPEHPSVPALERGEEWLTGFPGPVGLVWGERDPILGHALGRHERALPRAFVVRTAAGHFLQEEVPEEIAAAIRRVAG
jgi:haloalkane dehalogenase